MLFLYLFLDLLPFNTKRRISEHIVKLFIMEPIIGKAISELDIDGFLPFYHHV